MAKELMPFLETKEDEPLLEEFMKGIDLKSVRTVDFLVALNLKLFERVKYLIRLEPGVQTPEETLEKGSGSCRDSAWLLVHVLRRLGLAARFVSGYLVQLAPDRKNLDGPSGPEKDFTDLHAWCEVYLPGAGWVGLDPTSGLFAGEGHIPLACSPEPGAAAPISGAVEKCETEFGFEMEVIRLPEAPRSTRPYDEATWLEIDRLGRDVDKRLTAADIRLTMGGEPTFVSIDDFDGAEWNTEAMGSHQEKTGAPASPEPARTLRSGWRLAPWPRQAVSRRKPSSLGLPVRVAQRWRARVARPVAVRRRFAHHRTDNF
jgi:hypothetical protein